ncbi:MAG: hypothetical protein KDK65_01485, partial [Chlamydiia bacterium]|nr:hypothetical protein [Chlamydiia bacterium]
EQFQKTVETPHQDIDQQLLQRVLDKLHNLPQHLAQSKAATEMAGQVVNSFESSMRRLRKDLERLRRRIPLKSENVKQVQKADTDTRPGG